MSPAPLIVSVAAGTIRGDDLDAIHAARASLGPAPRRRGAGVVTHPDHHDGGGDALHAGTAEALARARAACSWLDHGLAGDIALSLAITAALRLLLQAVAWLLYAAGLFPTRPVVL